MKDITAPLINEWGEHIIEKRNTVYHNTKKGWASIVNKDLQL